MHKDGSAELSLSHGCATALTTAPRSCEHQERVSQAHVKTLPTQVHGLNIPPQSFEGRMDNRDGVLRRLEQAGEQLLDGKRRLSNKVKVLHLFKTWRWEATEAATLTWGSV